jgi:hypothetical protein
MDDEIWQGLEDYVLIVVHYDDVGCFATLTTCPIRTNGRKVAEQPVHHIRVLHWVPIPMPMPMGFGWAWVRYYCSWVGIGFVHPCIQLQIGVKLLGCREYANEEALRAEANDSERPFICPIQPRLGIGG